MSHRGTGQIASLQLVLEDFTASIAHVSSDLMRKSVDLHVSTLRTQGECLADITSAAAGADERAPGQRGVHACADADTAGGTGTLWRCHGLRDYERHHNWLGAPLGDALLPRSGSGTDPSRLPLSFNSTSPTQLLALLLAVALQE